MDRILLAFDGSPASWDGLDTAAKLARANGAEVGVIHVVPTGNCDVETEPLRSARETLETRGVHARTFPACGEPSEEIRRLALEGEFDTIVLGSRPRGLLKRLVDGSVTLDLAMAAPITVIVARTD